MIQGLLISQSWIIINYRNATIIYKTKTYRNYRILVCGHTSSKGCKYDLIVKFVFFTENLANVSATVTQLFQ